MKIDWALETTDYIWQDGEFVPWDDALVHVLTHTLHYGAGVFEGIRFYETEQGPAIFRLPEHTKRFFYSAESIGMKIPYSMDEISAATIETVRRNKVVSGYIRPLGYYGAGKMGLNPTGAPVNVSISCWPWGKYLGAALKVKTSKYIRIHPQSTVADAKIVGHYVNSILATLEAHQQGADEALLLDFSGNIAEGPGENFFMVKDGKVYTPRLGNVLNGITRDAIILVAREDLGLEVIEKDLTPAEVQEADELFFTGTAAEVSPISELDGQQFAVGEVTKALEEKFFAIVTGKEEKYRHWLTFVE